MANLLNLVKQNFHVQKREQTCPYGVNAIGKHRVKKRFFLEKDFLKTMAQNNNIKFPLDNFH